jgi:hypothetical protein
MSIAINATLTQLMVPRVRPRGFENGLIVASPVTVMAEPRVAA